MYNTKLKIWQSECGDPKKLEEYRYRKDDAEASFYLADNMISKAEKGKDTAQAVWMMERLAKQDCVSAVIAMGEMYRYGWAVKASLSSAIKWYEKAAALGSEEAKTALEELKKKRMHKRVSLSFGSAVIVLAAAVAAVFMIASQSSLPVKVHKDTDLVDAETVEDFGRELKELIDEYDDEQVIVGKRSTNRLVLRFESSELDLSDFLADKVILRSDNRVVIQFSSEEEAQRCLEILKNTDGIQYVEEDTYQNSADDEDTKTAVTTGQQYDELYESEYSGESYYSWGVIDLGLDEFAAWLKENNTDSSVVVAVVDGGVVPNAETEDRIIPGSDVVEGGDGTNALFGHGTHVAGVILDATKGLDVKIMPVRVLGYNNGTSLQTSQGIDYAVEQGVDVINFSVGGSHSADQHYSVQKALEAGITFVASAGNDAEDTENSCPAHMDECIVVSAYDCEHNPAEFTNFGDSVTFGAPGVDILSYWKDDSNLKQELEERGMGDEYDGYAPGNQLDNDVYVAFLNGTSMASPHIAALAALIKLQYPEATPAQVKQYIADYCVDMNDSDYFGYGICQSGMLAGN